MATLRDKNDPLRLMGRRLLLVALIVLVAFAGWGVWNIYHKERESVVLKQEAQAQLAGLEMRQAQLQGDYNSLETARGMEAAVRQEYTMGKPGEQEIIIVEPATETPLQATSSVMQWLKDVLSRF